jgi:hypothetical protein
LIEIKILNVMANDVSRDLHPAKQRQLRLAHFPHNLLIFDVAWLDCWTLCPSEA